MPSKKFESPLKQKKVQKIVSFAILFCFSIHTCFGTLNLIAKLHLQKFYAYDETKFPTITDIKPLIMHDCCRIIN